MEDVKNILEIKNLYKSYGTKEVLKGINLTVGKGQIVGLIGKNGIGKSTTIDCVTGSKNYNSGEIYINGTNIESNPIEIKKMFGYISSEPCLYETMTGYEYLSFIASVYGVSPSVFPNKVEELRSNFDLTENDLSVKIKGYSHGMKQKLSLIASLLHDPILWILDEPTVGLDIMVYHYLMKCMLDFVKNGKSILITSHNLDFIGKICNRVDIINNGIIFKSINLDENEEYRGKLDQVLTEIYGG
ncbi:MAG: ABC transporter ATP-binding protein [Acholeplasmatales bacterium]|jgi:ABC-2 type transport system ATP-binding protein|nr:ABC transporter ATP-binding protein [Acholeplasmatales bacterium]